MNLHEKLDKCLERLHDIQLVQASMNKDVSRNTQDLETHIKRTDLLEKKLTKIYAVMLIGAGVAIAHLGPDVLKFVGLLL